MDSSNLYIDFVESFDAWLESELSEESEARRLLYTYMIRSRERIDMIPKDPGHV